MDRERIERSVLGMCRDWYQTFHEGLPYGMISRQQAVNASKLGLKVADVIEGMINEGRLHCILKRNGGRWLFRAEDWKALDTADRHAQETSYVRGVGRPAKVKRVPARELPPIQQDGFGSYFSGTEVLAPEPPSTPADEAL